MSDVPKIVLDRLRAGQPQGAHPDADVLTAFAEQALPDAEREGVVAHLAHCGECREVVALSLPALEEVALPQAAGEKVAAVPVRRAETPRRNWFAWPNLAWGALAAGVIVAASLLLLRTGKQPDSTVATVHQPAANSVPAIPEAKVTAQAGVQAPARVAATPPAKTAKPDEAMLRSGPVSRPAEPAAGARDYQTPPAASADRKRSDSPDADKLVAAAPPEPAMTVGGITHSRSAASELSTLTGAVPAATQPAAEERLQARNEPPPAIAKAKAPTAQEQARLKDEASEADTQQSLANAYSASAQPSVSAQKAVMGRAALAKEKAPQQWSLAQGVLFRSAGKTSQVALRGPHPLLSFGALGSDVWAGGQAGTLFHSFDSGTTWAQIQPSTRNESLTSDIVAIEIRSATEIVLTTRADESWITGDGGKTWEKK